MITLKLEKCGFFDIPLVNVKSREEIEKIKAEKKAQAKKSQENQN